ncbi:MAG TPA: GAF domain-containing protein [Steroidobacteraceae bacterium]|nr:GAF domain-containing protein [Steroidobacteraceae bacterium]
MAHPPLARSAAADRSAAVDLYADLHRALAGLLEGEPDFIANCANFSALVYHTLPDLNWAGVYILRDGELVLGPFQGRPACVRIAIGRGVCGTAAARRASVLVTDVHEFEGHIVCDPVSRSELVVPLIKGDRLVGVFDMDSPLPARFGAADQAGIEAAAALLMGASRI